MKEEKKTKMQLIEELDELRGHNDVYRAIAEQSADAIATTDLAGRLTYVSPAFENMTGYSAEEVVGTRVAEFYSGGEEEARTLMERLRQEGQISNIEMPFRKKNGDFLEGNSSVSLLRDDSGTVIGTLGVFKDITEQRRAQDALRKSEERSAALYQVSNRLAGAHDTDDVLDLIVNEAARLLGAYAAMIDLLEGEVLVHVAATESAANYIADIAEAQPEVVVEEGTSGSGHVLATKKPLVMEDLSQDEYITTVGRALAQKHGFHSAAMVPLLANDRSIGVLMVLDKRVRRITDDEVSLLTAFADQASLALEKARLLSEAERERERAEALYQVSNRLAGVHETDEVLDLIVNEAARLLGTTGAYIRLLEGDVLVPSVSTESMTRFLAEIPPFLAVGAGTNKVGHAMATKKPFVTEDLAKEAVNPASLIAVQKHGFHGFAIVPLLANNRPIGTLGVVDIRIRRITDDEVSLLTAFADQASLALEKARLLSEAERERERAEALYQVSNRLAGVHETDEVLDLIVNEATRL